MMEYYHDVRGPSPCNRPASLSPPRSRHQLHNRFLNEQVLGNHVSDEHLPDVNLIGEMGDVTELGKLVQLVLGCAVSCEKKQGEVAQVCTSCRRIQTKWLQLTVK